jgi:hypothetical protein
MDRRLLYFTATRVLLYRWAHASLAVESSFANNEDGAQDFAAHLRGVPASLFYVLVDIVEEDFHQENVPFVRGGDRRALLARKLAQRYRDTSLAVALSLGYEKTQRRDERILFSSFTNNAQFQPWLGALREQEAAVAGVYSVALLAPRLAAKLGSKKAPLLLVSLQQAGLRQSYVENGKIRFSRLGPLEAADAADPARVAEAFDRETTRVYQYLTAMRVVARDSASIDAVLIAPPGEKRRIQAAGPNMPQVRAAVIELGEAARAIGLKAFPDGSGAEVLFLHLLAQRAPAHQYAGDNLRQYFRLHQLRVGLVAGGAAICLLALVYAGTQLAQRYGLEEQTNADRQRVRAAADQYARVTAGFPQLPTTTDNLRLTMQRYAQLTKQSSAPERLAVELSRALDAAPNIEVDRIRWELTANPKERRSAGAAPPRSAPQQPAPQPGVAPAAKDLYELAEITGKVVGPRRSDYRNINLAVDEFVNQLRRRPGVEVIQAKLPFEVGPDARLSGDIGAEAVEKVPLFSVIVARRLGS